MSFACSRDGVAAARIIRQPSPRNVAVDADRPAAVPEKIGETAAPATTPAREGTFRACLVPCHLLRIWIFE
jgi:hypothetical protein